MERCYFEQNAKTPASVSIKVKGQRGQLVFELRQELINHICVLPHPDKGLVLHISYQGSEEQRFLCSFAGLKNVRAKNLVKAPEMRGTPGELVYYALQHPEREDEWLSTLGWEKEKVVFTAANQNFPDEFRFKATTSSTQKLETFSQAGEQRTKIIGPADFNLNKEQYPLDLGEKVPCRSCKKMINEKAAFCKYCGVSQAEMVKCRHCNKENRSDAKYCRHCGSVI